MILLFTCLIYFMCFAKFQTNIWGEFRVIENKTNNFFKFLFYLGCVEVICEMVLLIQKLL